MAQQLTLASVAFISYVRRSYDDFPPRHAEPPVRVVHRFYPVHYAAPGTVQVFYAGGTWTVLSAILCR